MICYGYRTFRDYEVIYHCYYSKELHKFDCWQVLPLLGEWEVPSDFQETFDKLDKSIYKF